MKIISLPLEYGLTLSMSSGSGVDNMRNDSVTYAETDTNGDQYVYITYDSVQAIEGVFIIDTNLTGTDTVKLQASTTSDFAVLTQDLTMSHSSKTIKRHRYLNNGSSINGYSFDYTVNMHYVEADTSSKYYRIKINGGATTYQVRRLYVFGGNETMTKNFLVSSSFGQNVDQQIVGTGPNARNIISSIYVGGQLTFDGLNETDVGIIDNAATSDTVLLFIENKFYYGNVVSGETFNYSTLEGWIYRKAMSYREVL